MYVCMYVCICMYVCMYVCRYVCIYVCIYIYINFLNNLNKYIIITVTFIFLYTIFKYRVINNIITIIIITHRLILQGIIT